MMHVSADCSTVHGSCLLECFKQGSATSWKVLEFFCKISRTGKVLQNDFGPGKSRKFKLKVLERHPTRNAPVYRPWRYMFYRSFYRHMHGNEQLVILVD